MNPLFKANGSKYREIALRYGAAALAIAGATAVRGFLDPWLGDRVPFGIYFVAVIFAAWYGGFGPSLLALVLGTLAASHFFIDPHNSMLITDPADLFSLLVYFAVGIASTLMSRSLRSAQERAETAAAENARLNEELLDADRRKDEVLAVLAHELRNPLAPIRNALAILRGRRKDADVTRQAHSIIERQVEYIIRLVDDLSDLARIKRGKIVVLKETVNLATVVARAVEMSQPQIDAKEHRLRVTLPDDPLTIHADPVRIAQVLTNLLNNSAKYSNRESTIALTVRKDGNSAVVRVEDNGIGIHPADLPTLFHKFVQPERSNEHAQGGLGIGLALVKALVELHDGTVDVSSPGVGLGSSFVVRLPINEQTAPEREHQSSVTSSSRRILVVDDTTDAADSLAMLLELEGHELKVAYDGIAALDMAESFLPEVVLLDIEMPDMNGYEVARRLRQMDGLKEMLLVALTGWGQPEDIRRTKAAGFDQHLVKPIDLEVLNRVVIGREAPANTARHHQNSVRT